MLRTDLVFWGVDLMIIRNIWAVGRNYQDHIREMNPNPKAGSTPSENPIIFLKAGSSASVNSNRILLPWWTTEVHHEVELALKLNPQLRVMEGAIALDLTERSLQKSAKEQGLPWTVAKSFDGACPVSAFFPFTKFQEAQDLEIKLWVNGELRQHGHTRQMIFKCEEILSYLLERFPLCPGDLILTGTPSGVGPLQDGDQVRAEIPGHLVHQWTVAREKQPEKKEQRTPS